MNSAMQELEALHLGYLQARNPNFPSEYLPKLRLNIKTSNGLTNAIVKFINYKGGFATRINTTGIYDTRIAKFRPSNTQKGFSDINGTFEGKALYIEVKIGLDRMSEDQKNFQKKIIETGGNYFIAKDFESFIEWFKNKIERKGVLNV
jgi:hypothetical protein